MRSRLARQANYRRSMELSRQSRIAGLNAEITLLRRKEQDWAKIMDSQWSTNKDKAEAISTLADIRESLKAMMDELHQIEG